LRTRASASIFPKLAFTARLHAASADRVRAHAAAMAAQDLTRISFHFEMASLHDKNDEF
jgi:hypothetical protein